MRGYDGTRIRRLKRGIGTEVVLGLTNRNGGRYEKHVGSYGVLRYDGGGFRS